MQKPIFRLIPCTQYPNSATRSYYYIFYLLHADIVCCLTWGCDAISTYYYSSLRFFWNIFITGSSSTMYTYDSYCQIQIVLCLNKADDIPVSQVTIYISLIDSAGHWTFVDGTTMVSFVQGKDIIHCTLGNFSLNDFILRFFSGGSK